MKKLFKKIGAGFAAASGACLMTAATVALTGCTDNGGNVANGVSEETSIAENITNLKGLVLRSLASFDFENLDSTTVNSGNFGSSLYLKKVRFCTLDPKTLAIGDSCFDGTVNENSSYEVKVESNGWRYGLLEVDVSDVDESRRLEFGYTEEFLESHRYKMHAIIDAKNLTASNVNILTAWKYYQVKKLVESGASVESAMAQAEEDVLASIGIYGEYENFGRMDVYGNTKSDHLLLAATYLMDIPSISDNSVVARDMRNFVRNNEIHNDPFWLSMGLEKPSEEIVDQVERFVTNYFAVDAGLGRCEESNDGQIVRAGEHDFGYATIEINKYGLSLKCSDGLWGWYVPELEHTVGTMTDSRDGHVYKTTSFTVNGTVQTWMAEDLKYDLPGSKCLQDSSELCEKYGRLYTWPDVVQLDTTGFTGPIKEYAQEELYGGLEECIDWAMTYLEESVYAERLLDEPVVVDSMDAYKLCVGWGVDHEGMLKNVDIRNHQGICPDGWRVPSEKDWKLLTEYIGDDEHLAVKLMKKDSWIGAKGRQVDLGRFNLYNRASDVMDFSAVPNVSYGRSGRYAIIPSFDATDIEFHGTYVELSAMPVSVGVGVGDFEYEYYEADDYGPAGLYALKMGVRCIKNQ